MSELIQCEFCEIYICFEDYMEHIAECTDDNITLSNSNVNSLNTSVTSSLVNSINELISNDDISEDTDYEDEEEDEMEIILRELNNINIPIPISSIINATNFNFYDPYQTLSNLEDVNTPVQNIELVAPLIEKNLVNNDINCSICQDSIGNNVRKTLCNHYYCAQCIEPWLKELNKTCPSCLANLEDLYLEQNKKTTQIETTKTETNQPENTIHNDIDTDTV
jgi:hypothetical protein